MDKIRIGLLGCGSWGPRYASALIGNPIAELTTAVDIDIEKARRITRIVPHAKVLSDPEKLFNSADIDGILIVTPTPTHLELAKAALKAGKHVLVEKPLALNLAEANQIVQISEITGRLLMVGQILRFMPTFIELRSRVMAGDIGTVLHSAASSRNQKILTGILTSVA